MCHAATQDSPRLDWWTSSNASNTNIIAPSLLKQEPIITITDWIVEASTTAGMPCLPSAESPLLTSPLPESVTCWQNYTQTECALYILSKAECPGAVCIQHSLAQPSFFQTKNTDSWSPFPQNRISKTSESYQLVPCKLYQTQSAHADIAPVMPLHVSLHGFTFHCFIILLFVFHIIRMNITVINLGGLHLSSGFQEASLSSEMPITTDKR